MSGTKFTNGPRSIEAQTTGILIKLFGVSAGILDKKRPAQCRSGVRPVFGLVEVTGIEPATSNMPCLRSPS
jgi:hypothetical protein